MPASPQHLSLPYLSPIQLTVLNAGRKYLHLDSLSGKVFLTSGLGGMSGAQAKAAVICGCIGVVAEVSEEALKKRHEQGWLLEYTDNLDNLIRRIREARRKKEVTSIGFHGNVVSVWERLVQEYEQTGELLVELGSDQTSCHNPFSGGYYPVQLSFKEAQEHGEGYKHDFECVVISICVEHVVVWVSLGVFLGFTHTDLQYTVIETGREWKRRSEELGIFGRIIKDKNFNEKDENNAL
nr:urocanate hydratase-like [Penaeus vannamei]